MAVMKSYSQPVARANVPKIIPVNGIQVGLILFVSLQFLSPVLLFFPGAQAIRSYIRAIPYVSSLLWIFLFCNQKKGMTLPVGGMWVIYYLVLLMVSLFHPTTILESGWAQCVFQVCIVGPIFWAHQVVDNKKSLNLLLWLIFLSNAASAFLGVLQVYYPAQFMPSEFNSYALALNPDMIASLSYRGADNTQIIRPPGLSDMPGGAAQAGAFVTLFGILLGTQVNMKSAKRVFCLAMAMAGLFSLFMTQVRSTMITLLGVLLFACFLLFKRKWVFQASLICGITFIMLSGAFIWAVSIGGNSVANRYESVYEDGLLDSYSKHRGGFLAKTLTESVWDYPLGAGVGRWGLMWLYFGRDNSAAIPPLWAEIQLTGWLLDGGILAWFLYGGGIFTTLFYAYRIAMSFKDDQLAYLAIIIIAMNLLFVGQSFAGPAFNNKNAIQFWLLASALCGVVRGSIPRRKPDAA